MQESARSKGITVVGIEASDGLRRAPDRGTAAQDDPVDVEGDAEGRPRGRRGGAGQPAARRALELRPRPRRRAAERRAEAPHAVRESCCSGPRVRERDLAWRAVDSLFPLSLERGPPPLLLPSSVPRLQLPEQRQPHAGLQTRSSVITMAAHAPLAVPHASAGPRLAAPSLRRARCPRGSLANQRRRMRHLLPPAAAAKPGAIGIRPLPSLFTVLAALIVLFGSVKAMSVSA
jgi:hypothetical protein